MEVLQALGLNYTIGIQFIVFFVAYIFLSNLLFKPYLAAFVKRKEQTEGQETLAESLDLTTQDLHLKVDALQRELALKIQAIFNEAKKLGAKEAGTYLDGARTESQNMLANANQKIAHDVDVAKKEFQRVVPEISQTIVEKLVGRSI
jgi:F0F1-type ATP synthase membrane subunit b/b'